MSSRLAFQTQLASIMEVLANAAVAEICKLVDDDYAVVSLQMSQCQRENKALKRKLHLLELKLARGNAERRLRESAMNSSRPRLQIPGDRLRESSPSSGGVIERRMEMALWSSRASARNCCSESVSNQRKSPDVELVESEVLVKEEKVEANMSHIEETEEEIPLIGDDGVVECIPHGSARQRPSVELQDTQSTSSSQSRIQIQSSRTRSTSSSRGVEEEEPDVMLVKVEEPVTVTQSQTGLSIQEGVVESSTDDYRAVLPFDEITQTSTNQLSDLQESGRGLSESGGPEPTSIAAIQLRVPEVNTPTNHKSQQQGSSNNNSVTSEYSLFELETFFTRWAPDEDSGFARSGPSCPFTSDDSADCDQDGVIIVESKPPPKDSAVRMSGGQSFSSVQSQPSVSQDTSVSKSLRIQAPSSQPSWSRKAMMRRGADARLLQHNPNPIGWMSQQPHSIPSAQTTSTTAAVSCSSGDKTSLSSISSTSQTMSSSAAPSVRVPSAALTSIEAAIAAQCRASLLTCHNKSQAANIMPSERRRKSYVCRACGKAFSGLSNLEAHERVHTGEKPFRCDTCGKRFSEAGNLKKHHRVHTGEKPFSCDLCGKKFAWICNLRTHQQSATGCGPQARRGLGLDRTINAGSGLFTNTEAQCHVFIPK